MAFDCDDNREFQARLSDDRDEVLVDVGDERYDLDYVDRENGRRVYTNSDGVRLEVSDDDTDLRIPGQPDFQDCERS